MEKAVIKGTKGEVRGCLRYFKTKPLQSINTVPLFSHNSNCLYDRRSSLTCRTPMLNFNRELNRVKSPSPKEHKLSEEPPIEMQDSSDREESMRVLRHRSKWKLLRCVFRAVTLFQTNETEAINNEEDFNKALQNVKCRKESTSSKKTEYEEHFREERFYDLIAGGDTKDIGEIEEMLGKDKRTRSQGLRSPGNLVNCPNRMGRTPLHIATQNGNLAMVKYLISKKANPLINSRVSNTKTESNLLVASRWKHAKIVEFYITFYEWPYTELRRAKKEAGNAQVRQMLGKHMKAVKPSSCFLWCCLNK
eukprot:TRINITY_DN12359_c0_g4_i1.p1 TRINITY_DN12359_c0_g4~~TRINITY_DN12359_c0_g4_i1.p1  ORF type:complete len:306 (+),score=59.66 TRINITY_DN12359_c0_g4_i1:85-1002(+)